MVNKIIDWCQKNKFFVIYIYIFLVLWSVWTLKKLPIDAIPDLSDVQVIIYVSYEGKSPSTVELQATYPIVSSLLSAPKVKTVRGYSFFGFALIFVIFEDGVDIYWARSRVLEYLQGIELPEGVQIMLGPDATGVGWGFQYALSDKTGKCDLACLRSLNDWYIKYVLRSVPGVAEVESVGGFVKQYQVLLDPLKLKAYNVSVEEIISAIRKSNLEVGGRLIEISGAEFFIRGSGFIKSKEDVENIQIRSKDGTPIFLRDVAEITLGGDIRRGAAELNGEGEVVGGVVVVRYGENLFKVVKDVKKKLDEIKSFLPDGVEIVTTYDRSDLIQRSIDNLKRKITEECVVVLAVSLIFLFNFSAGIVVVVALPVSVLLALMSMYYLKITSNIMSLAGIALAIGTMVDAMIIMIENSLKKLENEDEKKIRDKREREKIISEGMKEVARSLLFSMLVITVSFLPIFFLSAQEGRLFKPLAWTKTLSMFFAILVSMTLTPSLATLLIRKKPIHEEKNPIFKITTEIYHRILGLAIRWRNIVLPLVALSVILSFLLFKKLGREFMPELNEGTILYMPTTLPGISITSATKLLQIQDRILKSFPEVLTVFGKVGRAETSTDPAPLSMIETTIVLKPEKDWPCRVEKEYSFAPNLIRPILKKLLGECRRWNLKELVDAMDKEMQFPGVANAWTMPIKNRIDMITTGIKTPLGIKIFGPDLKIIEKIGVDIERELAKLPETRSVYAERVIDGYYVDINVKKEVAERYGFKIGDVYEIVETAIGGKNISFSVEGRERYPIQVRFARDFREDIEALKNLLIPTPSGYFIPLGEIAELTLSRGPSTIKTEKGYLTGWVYIDISGTDIGRYVDKAKKVIEKSVQIPPGYWIEWSGQYEYMERVKETLKFVIPLTLAIIFSLIYLNTKSLIKTLIVIFAVPFSLVGAILILYLLGYNISTAVWVGLIALAGLDAETGVVMLLFLDLAYEDAKKKGTLKTDQDLKEVIFYGAVKRLRPKLMTVLTAIVGLLPIMIGEEPGSDVGKRIVAPMIGGLISSFILELLVYPTIFYIWKKREIKNRRSE